MWPSISCSVWCGRNASFQRYCRQKDLQLLVPILVYIPLYSTYTCRSVPFGCLAMHNSWWTHSKWKVLRYPLWCIHRSFKLPEIGEVISFTNPPPPHCGVYYQPYTCFCRVSLLAVEFGRFYLCKTGHKPSVYSTVLYMDIMPSYPPTTGTLPFSSGLPTTCLWYPTNTMHVPHLQFMPTIETLCSCGLERVVVLIKEKPDTDERLHTDVFSGSLLRSKRGGVQIYMASASHVRYRLRQKSWGVGKRGYCWLETWLRLWNLPWRCITRSSSRSNPKLGL